MLQPVEEYWQTLLNQRTFCQNLKIQTNVIEASYKTNVKKFLFWEVVASIKFAEQPIKEEAYHGLEPTNESYAIAKISGIKLCQALRKQYGFDAISLCQPIYMEKEITMIRE